MTIKEIARLAGVSTATVSYVINNTKNVLPEKRQRILDVIEQSGYQPNHIAKSLRVKKTYTIGVLAEDIRGFTVPAIINGLTEYAEKEGYYILLNDLRMMENLLNRYDMIGQYKDKVNKAISLLLHRAMVDAIIYIGMSDRDITGIINEINKPLVIAYSTTNDSYARSVTYDNEYISRNVIEHLLEAGHRRIAIITGPLNTSPACMRMRGAEKAFAEAGLELDEALVRHGDWEYNSGYIHAIDLIKARPTAIFAMNDLMAAGAIAAIHHAKLRVPDDISVFGFDNREIASLLQPKLTTVEIDLKGIGSTAAQMALKGIRGESSPECCRVIPSRLILRETVAPINI
ncbi:MAG: LacI family transcriptional regulator [Lachnospiraceae bacterium]|nr:LacI family transcriptional regulator [Lachnospiraceae bacterium]